MIIASPTNEKTIISTKKVYINVDKLLKEIENETFDAVILPGGQPGSDNNSKVII